MDLSLGTTPQGMPGDLAGFSQTDATTAVKGPEATKLPLTEKPVQDQISKSTDPTAPKTENYGASSQTPVLDKPKETEEGQKTGGKPKETGDGTKAKGPEGGKDKATEKTDEKKASEGSDAGLSDQPIDQPSVDPEQKPEQEQDGQQGGGQGGGSSDDGGSGGNNSGSSSGNSDSGSHSHSEEPTLAQPKAAKTATESPPSNVSNNTASTTTTNTTQKTTQPTADTSTAFAPKAQYSQDPTTSVKVSPLDYIAKVTSSGLFSPPINPAQFFDNGGKIQAEINKIISKYVATLPEGPEKMRSTDYLLMIQTALVQFQTYLHAMQGNDSKGARERSKAQLETTLAKIEEQKKNQEEIAKKQGDAAAKAKIMGPLMIIFALFMFVFMAALLLLVTMLLLASGPAGWMALAMLVCGLVDTAAQIGGKKPFLMAKFVNALTAISDGIVTSANPNDSPAELKEKKLIAKTVMVSVAMAMAFIANPLVFVFGGITALLSFLNESHIIRDMQIQAGKSEAEATQVETYVSMAIGIAFAIVALGIALLCPPVGLGAAFGLLVKELADAAAQAAKWVAKTMQLIVQLIENSTQIMANLSAIANVLLDPQVWLSATALALQTTSAVATYHYQSILADISRIQGQFDAEMELKDTTLQILKKMIKQLLDSLQGIGQDIAQLGQALQKTHKGVSDITTHLFAG